MLTKKGNLKFSHCTVNNLILKKVNYFLLFNCFFANI